MPVNCIVQIMHSLEATVLSIAALISAIVLLLSKFKELMLFIKSIVDFFSFDPKRRKGMKPQDRTLVSIFFLLLIVPAVVFTTRAVEPIPPNVRMMNEVWEVFNKAKETNDNSLYVETINKAEALIHEFEPGARFRQKNLLEKNVKILEPGTRSIEEKKTIWEFGPLHEVSAAWWVIGRAMNAQGNTQEAIKAFKKAMEYPHALVYDPTWDGFWSPAEDAEARIEYLETN